MILAPMMAGRLSREGLIKKLCNGFWLLMDPKQKL